MKALIVPIFVTAALSGGIACGDDLLTSQPPNYRVIKLADLGGSTAAGNSINDIGLVAGFSDLPDGNSRHAMLWLNGFKSDLGTLGGPNSNVAWPVKNTIGLVTGIAQTDIPEPLGQTWSCRSFFAFPTRSGFICLGAAWENGQIRALPTLGGHNGFATGSNNNRQIVGWAQNTVLDSTCNPLHVKQQFRAVIWGPGKDQIQELPPLGDERTSAATAINDKGQVVGISGACGTAVGGVSARYSVMWEKGRVRNIGDLGGVAWNTPMAINERGDVVGFSNFSASDGAAFRAHAFLVIDRGRILDLGVLPGMDVSQALGINEKRQIVGTSCKADFSICHAFLWEKGTLIDLNDRVPGHPDVLYNANDINDDGQIAGQSFTPGTQQFSAFWAVPLSSQGGGTNDGDPLAEARRKAPMPANVRAMFLSQFGLSDASLVPSSP
jgi:probable HAF family extracellular repeat protein